MLKHNITAANDAIRAFLTTLLGQKAPLRAGTLQVIEPDALQADAKALFGLVPDSGNFAVVLDPGWLPLVAGLKLGVETKVGDDDYDTVAIELAERFYETVATHFGNLGVELRATTFEIKEPGKPIPAQIFGEENGKIPFFMEWKGQLMHGFVLVAMDRIDMTIDEERLASVPAPIPILDTPEANSSMGTLPESDEPESPSSEIPELISGIEPTAEHVSDLRDQPTASHGNSATSASPQSNIEADESSVRIQTAAFPELGSESMSQAPAGDLGMLADVELDVTVELGRRRIPLSDILRLTSGSVVELEKLVGEPLQVFANSRLIAEGEAVVIDDQFGVRITSLASRAAEKRVA